MLEYLTNMSVDHRTKSRNSQKTKIRYVAEVSLQIRKKWLNYLVNDVEKIIHTGNKMNSQPHNINKNESLADFIKKKITLLENVAQDKERLLKLK